MPLPFRQLIVRYSLALGGFQVSRLFRLARYRRWRPHFREQVCEIAFSRLHHCASVQNCASKYSRWVSRSDGLHMASTTSADSSYIHGILCKALACHSISTKHRPW